MTQTHRQPIVVLERRVRGEFDEMPGLRLTLDQASRLLDVEPTECGRLLDTLVASGFLRRVGQYYFRADYGRVTG